MKHKLLFALAGALMSMSAMAQDVSKWADPTRPTFPSTPAAPTQYTGSWATPEVGGKYYLYNVGAGLFLGGGQTWGTRGIVLADSVVLLNQDPVAINNVSNNTTANYVLPFEIVAGSQEGTVQFNDLCNSKATSGVGHFVGEDGAQAWIDGDNDRNTNYGDWTFQPYEGGYMIQNVYASTLKYPGEGGEITRAYGVDGHNTAGTWATTWTDLWIELPEGNTTLPYLVWQFVDANDGAAVRAYANAFKEAYNSEAYQATLANYQAKVDEYNDQMAVYNAKIELRNTMAEADAAGIDVSEAEAVYNNASATLEEIDAQRSHLRALIAGMQYDFSGASESNPLDVTNQVLTNPDFEYRDENGNLIADTVLPPGWDITITGQNCGQRNRTDKNESTGLTIINFIEAWHPNSLGDGVIAQTIYGLPKGKYVLECDASACHDPANGDGSDIVGVNLFIQAGANKVTTRVGTARLGITHYSVTYVNDGSDVLTFGLEAISTNANWLSADNFKLTYYGETTKSQEELALEDAIARAEAIANNIVGNDIEDASIFNLNADVAAAFEEAINNAKAALSGTSDEMKAAVAALDDVTVAATASNELYKKFQEVYNNALLTAQELQEAGQWSELQDNINDWAESELAEAFNAGSLTEDDLAAAQGKVDELIAEFLNDPEKIQAGDEVTILLKNPHFKTGTTADPTGWTLNSGSMTELASSVHNIEAYHRLFDLSQTLKNMPAGVYDVTLQGFARHDDGGPTDKSYLYGGITKSYLIDLNNDEDQTREEPLYFDGSTEHPYIHDGNYDTNLNSVNGEYTSNGMAGSYYWFQEINPKTGEPYYTNHVKVILDKPGDLTIGIRSEDTHDWVIFDNFRIVYQGQDLSSYYEMIAAKGDELNDTYDNVFKTDRGDELTSDVQAKIEAAGDITDVDEALALLAEIEEVIDYLKEGDKLAAELTPLVDEYAMRYEEMGLDEPAFQAMLESLSDKVAEYETFADNDEIAKGIEDLKNGWIAAVVASAEVGDELQGIILNPDFETGNLNNWTDTFTAGNHGFQNNNTYADADGNVVIANFAESWNNTNFVVDGEISQNIGVLPEGWYQLEMDGYAVNQSQAGGAPAEGVQGVDLFAKTGANIAKQNIGIDGENGVSQHWTLGFYSDGVSETTIGVVAEGANCNWTAFDNFKLVYFGDKVPDAVESIATETTAAPKAIFTLDGRQTSTLRRGINIVRKADGSVQKVLVK